MVLISLALPRANIELVKGRLVQTVNNYRMLWVITQSANLDARSAGASGSFPADATNGWSNAVVPKYIQDKTFRAFLAVDGKISNATVYRVSGTNDSNTVFLATANLSSNGVSNKPPFGLKGGALVTLGGDALVIFGTNISNYKECWTKLIWPIQTVQP